MVTFEIEYRVKQNNKWSLIKIGIVLIEPGPRLFERAEEQFLEDDAYNKYLDDTGLLAIDTITERES